MLTRVPRLLVVHHTPTPTLREMLDAALSGANDDAIEGVTVVVRPALEADAADVLASDGYLLGTTANIGYMSGALKHFFDTVYYPALEAGGARPYGLFVHGNNDTTGAVRSVQTVTRGMGWRAAAAPVTVVGPLDDAGRDALVDLGGTLAATLAGVLDA
jgi:NAD(P)H-dependent FMN reductase